MKGQYCLPAEYLGLCGFEIEPKFIKSITWKYEKYLDDQRVVVSLFNGATFVSAPLLPGMNASKAISFLKDGIVFGKFVPPLTFKEEKRTTCKVDWYYHGFLTEQRIIVRYSNGAHVKTPIFAPVNVGLGEVIAAERIVWED